MQVLRGCSFGEVSWLEDHLPGPSSWGWASAEGSTLDIRGLVQTGFQSMVAGQNSLLNQQKMVLQLDLDSGPFSAGSAVCFGPPPLSVWEGGGVSATHLGELQWPGHRPAVTCVLLLCSVPGRQKCTPIPGKKSLLNVIDVFFRCISKVQVLILQRNCKAILEAVSTGR